MSYFHKTASTCNRAHQAILSAAILSALLTGADAASAQESARADSSTRVHGPLILKAHGSFVVGGQVVSTDAATVVFTNILSPSGTIMQNGMYTQFMIPEGRAHVPVVLIHGGGLSGSCYETTPDGRTGWNEYFVRRGFPVYLPDQVGRGRSGFNPTDLNKVTLGQLPPSENPKALVETREDAWQIFRFGPSFGIPFPGEQFPVEHADDLAKEVIPDINASLPVPNPTYANLAALSDKLKGAVLVGHSESSCFPFQAALVHPDNIKGIISIEGCSMALTPQQVSILKRIPALVLYGDNIAAGSVPVNWSAAVAASQTFVQTLKSAGGDATLVQLADIGIKGNSHMVFQDKNNLEVADVLIKWIRQHVADEDEDE